MGCLEETDVVDCNLWVVLYASQSYPLLMRKVVMSLKTLNETALCSRMMMMVNDGGG